MRKDDGRVAPIMIVAGNKCDLAEMRKVSAQEGLRWARERRCGFMETSARECVNVEETFARRSFCLSLSLSSHVYIRLRDFKHQASSRGLTPFKRKQYWSAA